MIIDFLKDTCYFITKENTSADGIFKESVSRSSPICCRINNANTRDMVHIHHIKNVVKEYKKVYLSAVHKDDISYDTFIEIEGQEYTINNINTPGNMEEIHHIELLVYRVIGNSS